MSAPYDLAALRELLEKATPTGWQQSRYVQHRRYGMMPDSWHEDRRRDEEVIIRGPGIVGSPECNPIGQVRDPADRALIVAAVNALPSMLSDLRRLAEAREAGVFGRCAAIVETRHTAITRTDENADCKCLSDAAALRTLCAPPQKED